MNARTVRVKICGITNRRDAETAIALGAHALGFNFYPGSPRFLNTTAGAEWIHELPPFVTRVAVLVNQPDLGRDLFDSGLVHCLQLHGDEEEPCCLELRRAGIPFIKAIRVRDAASLENIERFHTRDILLDAYHAGAYGGTGAAFNWDLAASLVGSRADYRVILSGGLNPGNVAEAIRRVRPHAVDVASGVEAAGDPRRKDPERVQAFMEQAI